LTAPRQHLSGKIYQLQRAFEIDNEDAIGWPDLAELAIFFDLGAKATGLGRV
jgi:hypothetical protein